MIERMVIKKLQKLENAIENLIKDIAYPLPFVLDANWVNGLGVIRSLGQIGLQSVAVNYDAAGVGLYSKYALGVVGPNPWDDPDGLVDLLIIAGRILPRKGVLFITDDKYMEVLSAAKDTLRPYFLFSFPDMDVLTKVLDKQEQYAAAEKAGLAHPRSMTVRSADDLEHWRDDVFPIVIKGVSGKDFFHRFGCQAKEVENLEEARTIIKQGKAIDFLVQEIIPGGEEQLFTLGCYINAKGETKGVFTGRKLRQYPRYYGTCTVGESVSCEELIVPALATLRNLNFHGITQVECKRDPRDGNLKLIEINGRFWKWHSLATACGVNLAASAYRDISGWGTYIPESQMYGLKWVVLVDDLRGVRKDILNKEFELLPWLRTIAPPFISGLFTWQDVKPFLMKIVFYLKKVFGIQGRVE